MHIVIIGTGGVGGYFGGRLAQSGEQVTFIARGDHLHAMQVDGLRVDSPMGDFTISPINATDDVNIISEADAILLCVKAWQVPGVAKNLIPLLRDDTFVVPLQNGIEAPYQLAEILGREHILGGACGILSHISAPGHIQHAGGEPWVVFAELDNHPSERTKALLDIFLHAGVNAEIAPDIQLALWKKLLFISTFSGIGAVTRVPVGIYRAHPGVRQMFTDALQECYSVALAHGIPLSPDNITDILESLDHFPPDAIASLQRDLLAGRPSELEAQIGVVVRLGQLHNIPTPTFSFIYNALLPLETLARTQAG